MDFFISMIDAGESAGTLDVTMQRLSEYYDNTNKLNNKVRYYHTGWVGGLKEIKYKNLMKENPEKAMWYAVNGMLPNNSIGRKAITRLKVYRDGEHKNEAQKPEMWTQEIK